jgi:predicted GH43/DUF377 family glycosyl hydrolase
MRRCEIVVKRRQAGVTFLYETMKPLSRLCGAIVAVYVTAVGYFDAHDPTKLMARLDRPFFRLEMPYKTTGQYEAGTTFRERLIWFHGRWLLCHGCADSCVDVAVSQ